MHAMVGAFIEAGTNFAFCYACYQKTKPYAPVSNQRVSAVMNAALLHHTESQRLQMVKL